MDQPIILFDGVCNFCNGMVNFFIKADRRKTLRFAPLQSDTAKKLLSVHSMDADYFDSLVLIENGRAYNRSTAALKIYSHLPWYWQWTQLLWIFPRFIRDAAYNLIARYRYKIFGKRDECMVPTPELRSRFLS
jgi:predicted DCC family thiol-disulfide oxidoreductase YuxK